VSNLTVYSLACPSCGGVNFDWTPCHWTDRDFLRCRGCGGSFLTLNKTLNRAVQDQQVLVVNGESHDG